MKQRAISSIGVVLIGVVPAILGSPVFSVVVGLIAIGALYELYRAYQRVGARPSTWTGTVAIIALVVIAGTDAPFRALTGAMCAYTLLALAQHLVKKDINGALIDWSFSLSGVMYIGFTLMHFILIRRIHGAVNVDWIRDADALIGDGAAALGLAWLLFVLVTTWMTDVFAYLIGRQWGRVKLIPHISPGKTREGAVAGLLGGAITGLVSGLAFGLPVSPILLLVLGGLVALGAMIGDLCESLIKRQIGIKDMGSVIPGHGGVLDRIDALLVTVPFMFYAALFVGWLGWT
ncbi:MAG TPA: CDP-archaeol synthase [Thermomicrobiales bacterium]|jgi:phosphatidate cytidylyltransferase|nr:CDP-archaeol synthase [Thermomicrobiales bacterium]HRA32846.1 CDP-archaeol synthase [Thermomicrobiales bacterium]